MFESLSAHALIEIMCAKRNEQSAHRTRLSFQYKLHILMFISEKLQCEFNFRHNFRLIFFLKLKISICITLSSFNMRVTKVYKFLVSIITCSYVMRNYLG